MELENKYKQWILLDLQLKQCLDKIKEIREKRNILEIDITKQTDKNVFIKINNEKLKITDNKVTEPLTFKYLEKSLGEIIKNENQVKQIIEHVKQNREIKYVTEIKRYTNN
jgi:hypothetical protein